MKKMSDKEIQQLLEENAGAHTIPGSGKDMEAYRFVFDALNKKPAEGLPMNFSGKVTARIQAARDRRVSFIWYVLLPVFLFLAVLGIYLYLGRVDAKSAGLLGAVLLKFKWAFVFGSLCFLLIEYLDRKLVRV